MESTFSGGGNYQYIRCGFWLIDLKDIQRSDLRDETSFRVWFFSWISTPAPRNISSGELILRVSLFLIDLKQEVNCGGTNILIIWVRTIATLRLSAGSADARMLFTSQFTAMWQRKFIEHLLHAEQMCGAGKGNKKFSFHYNISCISCSWMPLTCLAQFRCSINVE